MSVLGDGKLPNHISKSFGVGFIVNQKGIDVPESRVKQKLYSLVYTDLTLIVLFLVFRRQIFIDTFSQLIYILVVAEYTHIGQVK